MVCKVCHDNVPYGAHYYFMPFTRLSDPIKSNCFLRGIVNSHRLRQVSVLCSCTLYWPHVKQLHICIACVAGRHGRREGAAEEMDNLPEGSALVLSAWWWLSLQHHPGHVCADAQPWRLEEHLILWSLHVSVVRTSYHQTKLVILWGVLCKFGTNEQSKGLFETNHAIKMFWLKPKCNLFWEYWQN